MMKSVLLVGCGNIGSRHLQSLIQLENLSCITVVEPDEIAKNNAKSFLSKTNIPTQIEWNSNISEIKDTFDFTIIATQATDRSQLINQLLKIGNRRFLIEKMVCQSSLQYQKILDDFKKFNAKGWVNTNFRYFSFYKELSKHFSKNLPLKFVISGGNKGLGSNAIHFLDLFSWFTNSNDMTLNGDYLSEELIPNKRSNALVEFSGTIIGQNNQSLISISFLPSNKIPIIVEILNSDHHVVIDTSNNSVFKIRGLENFSNEFKFQHTSELTKKIVSDIFQTDTCNLPTLNDLHLIHTELFRIFNHHIKKIQNIDSDICPIT